MHAEQEAKAKQEQEAKAKAEQEAKAKTEQEAKIKAKQEAEAKAAQAIKAKAEQERKDKQETKTKAEGQDSQGNPLNADGSLKVEAVSSVDEITDEDFTAPMRNVQLPKLLENVAAAIGTDGKPVVIKKNILKRNTERHPDVSPSQSREILKAALYTPNLYGQNQRASHPYNWVLISVKGKDGRNKLVLLEVNHNKDFAEIVHWHFVEDRAIEKIKKQAEREGGQLLILPSVDTEEAGALSGRPSGSASESKGNINSTEKHDDEINRYDKEFDEEVKRVVIQIIKDPRALKRSDGVTEITRERKGNGVNDKTQAAFIGDDLYLRYNIHWYGEPYIDGSNVVTSKLYRGEQCIKIEGAKNLSGDAIIVALEYQGLGSISMRDAIGKLYRGNGIPMTRGASILRPMSRNEQEAKAKAEQEAKAKDKDYSVSNEKDSRGNPFVLSSEGNIDFGQIRPETGLTPAPIRLSEGQITNTETNSGYGLKHIEARHGDEIRKAGFASVREFVEHVAKNYNRIQEGAENQAKDGTKYQSYLIQLTDEHNNTLFVELSSNGEYWSINSAGVFNQKYGDNKKNIWSASSVQNVDPATNSGGLRENGETGSTSTPKETPPKTSSTDKDTKFRKGQGETTTAIANTATVHSAASDLQQQFGVEVEVIDSPDNVPNATARKAIAAGQNVKGWYDVKTGKVYLYAPNIESEQDAATTYIHEVVAHSGMRQLLGEDKYNELCEKLYNQLTDEQKERISQYSDQSAEVQGDEYFAAIAETMIDERGNIKEPSLFRKVVAAIREFFRDILGISLSDNDIRYMLWKSANNLKRNSNKATQLNDAITEMRFSMESENTAEEEQIIREAKANGTYLKAPNGKDTNLTPKQWVRVRTKAFKRWFGDWELSQLYSQALRAWNNKESKGKTIVSLPDRAKQRLTELFGRDFIQLVITDDAIRHIKKQHGNATSEHARGQTALTAEDIVTIPYIIGNFDTMELIPTHDDKLGNKAVEVRKRINGVSIVGTIARGKDKLFVVTSWKMEKSDALDVSSTPGPNVRNDSDIAKVKKEIESIKEGAKNCSKVVDINGEPKVVYHQTNASFNTFDIGRTRTSMEIPAFFFAPEYDAYHGYGVNTIAAFLNLRNPIDNPPVPDRSLDDGGIAVRKMLVDAGHDGFARSEDGEGVVEYAAFYPNQIKSATENVGTYDPNNNDIRFAIGKPYDRKEYPRGYAEPNLATTDVNIVSVPKHNFNGSAKEQRSRQKIGQKRISSAPIPMKRQAAKGTSKLVQRQSTHTLQNPKQSKVQTWVHTCLS